MRTFAYLLLSTIFVCIFFCDASAKDSTAVKSVPSVQLPGTNVVLTQGMSVKQFRKALPEPEQYKTANIVLFKAAFAEIETGIGKYWLIGAFTGIFKGGLKMITLNALDKSHPEVESNLDQWFHAQVADLPSTVHDTTVEKSDTTETWTTPEMEWSIETAKDDSTQRKIRTYIIAFGHDE